MSLRIKVDVIIAVHNAESTIEETVRSAMKQVIPRDLLDRRLTYKQSNNDVLEFSMVDLQFDVLVCCYNDASTDKSLDILHHLEHDLSKSPSPDNERCISSESKTVIPTKLFTGTAFPDTLSRGAGYARNQAVKLRDKHDEIQKLTHKPLHHFLCILDSDDVMHPTRIAEQTHAMLALGFDNDGQHLCSKTLMGCQFDRIPKDSTWHYQNWANSLTDERVYLEQFRECTLIQPTWFFSKDWFISLGGYLEAPEMFHEKRGMKRKLDNFSGETKPQHYLLVHSSESIQSPKDSAGMEINTLRLAEDLRIFYAHLYAGGNLRLHRTSYPLVSYRHRSGMSQSSSTPRKLLLKLRAKAWEVLIYY
jgi:glycosyltransferase involved in cell wall biosynthesis